LREVLLAQLIAEATQRRVIGRSFLQRQADEAAKRHAVVERLFEAGVRKGVPLLQQQRLQHHQRLLGRTAGAIRPQPRQKLLKAAPVDLRRKTLQRGVLANFRRNPAVPESKLHRKASNAESESQMANFATIPLRLS